MEALYKHDWVENNAHTLDLYEYEWMNIFSNVAYEFFMNLYVCTWCDTVGERKKAHHQKMFPISYFYSRTCWSNTNKIGGEAILSAYCRGTSINDAEIKKKSMRWLMAINSENLSMCFFMFLQAHLV